MTTDRPDLDPLLVDVNDQVDADAAGYAEARSRLDEIDRGIVEPISADELFRRVQRRLAR